MPYKDESTDLLTIQHVWLVNEYSPQSVSNIRNLFLLLKVIVDMGDNGPRENGRHKADHYKSLQTQWMMPQYPLKESHTIKLLHERDNAIRERNIALAEKKAAMAERDMAILQRDAAVAERNTAIMERDNAIAALEYARENAMNGSCGPGCPPACAVSHRAKNIHHHNHHQQNHHQQDHHQHVHMSSPRQISIDPYDHSREMHIAEAYPISEAAEVPGKVWKNKRPRKETKGQEPHVQDATQPKKVPKLTRNKRVSGGEDLNKQATFVKPLSEWRAEGGGSGEDLNKQGVKHHKEWKDQDLGLNQVTFDETTMPVPVCSCTGKYQPCYKWGNGGWQSACCTTTISMYPLPVIANKRHSRMGGRKMSGSVFTRLLSRMAAEGHNLSTPLDLKDHWSKHGTNRFITIK